MHLKLPELKEVEAKVKRGSECLPVGGPVAGTESNPLLTEPEGSPVMRAEEGE